MGDARLLRFPSAPPRLCGEKNPGPLQFALDIKRRRTEELMMDHGKMRRGWCPGSEEFREELLAAAGKWVVSWICVSNLLQLQARTKALQECQK